MYKPNEPIRCPKCGAVVEVTTTRFPDLEWRCLMCGESGSIKRELTSGYIRKVDEPDLGIGVTTTNATGSYNTINSTPAIKSTITDPKSTACDIPAPTFIQQGWECPKCGAILAPHQHYCPFCSPSEYGRTNWLGTTYGEWTNKDNLTPPSGQYTNPYSGTTISVGDKLKKSDSCTVTFNTTNAPEKGKNIDWSLS